MLATTAVGVAAFLAGTFLAGADFTAVLVAVAFFAAAGLATTGVVGLEAAYG